MEINMFILTLFNDPRSFAAITLIVVFSICMHEYMHAWVAMKMGDPTAALNGHLTLNPFRQMGLMSLVMLLLFGIAWGKVPVNPRNLNTRGKRIAVAAAGAATNLLLALIFTFLAFLTLRFAYDQQFAAGMLIYGAMINLVLMIINLMPAPGLDGFVILVEFVRFKSVEAMEKANIVFFILLMILLFFIRHIIALAQTIVLMALTFLLSLSGV